MPPLTAVPVLMSNQDSFPGKYTDACLARWFKKQNSIQLYTMRKDEEKTTREFGEKNN